MILAFWYVFDLGDVFPLIEVANEIFFRFLLVRVIE